VRWDQLVTVGTPLQFEQTGHHDTQNLAPNWMRARDAEAKDVQNYRELLAKEGLKQNACFSCECWRGRGRKTAADQLPAGVQAAWCIGGPPPWEKSHTPQPKGARLRIFVVGI
jgi:hypothetical protein